MFITFGVVIAGGLLYGLVKTIYDLVFGLVEPMELFSQIYQAGSESVMIPLCLILSVAFMLGGLHQLRSQLVPVVFSIPKGYFYKGDLKEHAHPRDKDSMIWCLFEDIVALQLLAIEKNLEDDERVYIYECNIILKDASRVHVVYNNSSLKTLRTCAQTLAQAFNVPLWDNSEDVFTIDDM